jgi:hypothetical protein
MNLENLAHILRASRAITGEAVFVVLGSQAVLAQFPDAPESLRMSMEADLYPKFRPDLAEVIEGALGAHSPFHGAFGYHADGIGPETAILPEAWEKRAIRLEGHPLLEGAVAICPEIHDLCAAKLAAFRDKDRDWVAAAIGAGLASAETVGLRLAEIPRERLADTGPMAAWLRRFEGAGCEPD